MSNACFAGQWLFRCLSFQSHSNRGVDTCAVSLPFVCRRSVTTWESATFTWSSSVRYRVGMAVAVGRRLGSPLRGHLLQGRHRSWCRVLEKCLWGFWQQKLKVPDIYPHIYSHFSSICFFSVFFFFFFSDFSKKMTNSRNIMREWQSSCFSPLFSPVLGVIF